MYDLTFAGPESTLVHMTTMTLTVTEKWGTWKDRSGVTRRCVEWTAREGRRVVMRARSQESDPARDAYSHGQIDVDALKHLFRNAYGEGAQIEYVRKASDKERAVPRIIRVTY